ncbi:hypothetical protein MMC26_005235 [Xylographa opegraphella]|nr:hypothetical protein [Xylographa opegraphella]
MPGRVSTRTSTSSRVPRKASEPSLNPRASASRLHPSIVVPDEGPSNPLRVRICVIFGDAQKTTAGHRKLVINLRKIHEACCYEPSKPGKNELDDHGEDDFNAEFARCVLRLVGIKKSEAVGDRILRFLGLFLRHASEKDAALMAQIQSDDTQSLPETPSTRLTSHVLSVILPLLKAKEKTTRFRSTQIISHIINSLDSIDDEYYHLVRVGLLRRIRDKEPTVRVQAVLGLGRLASNEGDEEQEDEESGSDESSGLLEKLLEVLQHDPSAEVRRSLLLNLPLTPSTLPFLLERARDLDPPTRRALYSRLLPALGDFRHLSLSMREKLLRWGLRDRDENVRKATAKLFSEIWIEDCAGTRIPAEGDALAEVPPPNIGALLELLERIDVVNSGGENGVALEALREFWNGRPDYRDAVSFDDSFWDQLSAERVFLARSFNDFCTQDDGKYSALVEMKMPEVTKLAFFIQRYTNDLVDRIRSINTNDQVEEENTVEQEFIVEQLLYIAQTLDYSDEVGRRKMFSLLRESLAIAELPDEITRLVIEVLRTVCGTDSAAEREFCGVVLEAVAEVHDTIVSEDATEVGEDESFHSARSEMTDTTPTKDKGDKKLLSENGEQDEQKAIQEILVNLKCLHIAQCMLQNVEDNLQENVHLVTMLNNLVVPAVRSHEAPIRERGLLCLGLCCLLDKTLAEENLTLFLHCFKQGHDALQITAIHILSDILTTHPSLLTQSAEPNMPKSIFKVFHKGLKAAHAPDVQSAATTALCKLMLTLVITDEDLLKQLVICFFEPATKENAAMRQALSYFLPVYCHSRKENMKRMGKVVPGVLHALVGLEEELDEDEEMVGMTVVTNMLVEWTDARKLVGLDDTAAGWDEAGRKEIKAVNGDIHLDLADALLERVMAHGCPKEEKKPILSMLGKLYITSTSTLEKLQSVCELAAEAIELKIAPDAGSRNALTKLHTALSKALGETAPASPRKSAAREGVTVAKEEAETPEDTQMRDVVAALEESRLEDPMEDETQMEAGVGEQTVVEDSILDELLDEEEEEL